MDLQIRIIEQVMERFNRPTLKKLSELTGIQVSRLFRILSGHEMKLGEYLQFCQCIGKSCGEVDMAGQLSDYLKRTNQQVQQNFLAFCDQQRRRLELVREG